MVKPRRQILLVIAGLSALGVALGVLAWIIPGQARFTVHGYVALGLALVLGGGLAGGLMWLAFYSDRKGYDQPPED